MDIVPLVLSVDGAPNATADQAVGKKVPDQYQGRRNVMQAGIGFVVCLVLIVVVEGAPDQIILRAVC